MVFSAQTSESILTSSSRLEEAAAQMVQYLEMVKLKPNKRLTRKERLGVVILVDSYRMKNVAETKREDLFSAHERMDV